MINISSLSKEPGSLHRSRRTRTMVAGHCHMEAGWIDYMWPKPGETNPSKKLSYVRKVTLGNDDFYVGTGLYLD